MARVERVLLVINRVSGTGHGSSVVDGLRAALDGAFGGRVALRVEVVGDHPSARRCAAEYLMESEAPALVVVGGGSGTLGAVIQGLCEGGGSGGPPGRERVIVAPLRMGSGNPLARWFGMTGDPESALRGIIENLEAGRTAPCCVMRCEVGTPGSSSKVRYAATMAGFGQFGHAPSDLERWHRRLRSPRRILVGICGIERLNNAEYIIAMLARSLRCALAGPAAAEVVEVRAGDRREILPLLAGVAMNFPLGELPLDPGTGAEEEALSLFLVPFTQRVDALRMILAPRRLIRDALRFRIESGERVEIRLVDRDSSEFFLDEDPMTFHGRLALEVAGSLTFVPGPEYAFRAESGVAA